MNTEDKDENVNTLWVNFKQMLEKGIEKYIPHRTAKSYNGLPWLTSRLKKLIAKRDSMFVKSKKTGNDNDKKAFKSPKAETQKN